MRSIGERGEDLSSWPTSVALNRDGRVLVAQPNTAELPKLFDASGTLAAMLGGPGEGPGEYREATLVYFDTSDSIVVVDQRLGRLSILDRRGAFSRSFRVPSSTFSVLRGARGEFVLSAHEARPSEAGLPLRMLSSQGAFRFAFGSETPEYDVMHPANQLRHLAPSGKAAVWSVPLARRYVVELWGLDGDFRLRLERDVDWFRPYEELKNISPSSPPQPRVIGVWSVSESLVGLLVRVADPRWRSGLGATKKVEGHEVAEIRDQDRVFDTIVEFIDASSATILFSTRVDRALAGVAAPAVVYSVQQRADGFSVIHLYKVETRK